MIDRSTARLSNYRVCRGAAPAHAAVGAVAVAIPSRRRASTSKSHLMILGLTPVHEMNCAMMCGLAATLISLRNHDIATLQSPIPLRPHHLNVLEAHRYSVALQSARHGFRTAAHLEMQVWLGRIAGGTETAQQCARDDLLSRPNTTE